MLTYIDSVVEVYSSVLAHNASLVWDNLLAGQEQSCSETCLHPKIW